MLRIWQVLQAVQQYEQEKPLVSPTAITFATILGTHLRMQTKGELHFRHVKPSMTSLALELRNMSPWRRSGVI